MDMRWKKRGCLLQKIEILASKQEKGQISVLTGLFFLLFLATILSAHLQMEMFRSSSDYMEDALASSGLASALIDIREYGYSHVVRIPDAESAYEKYCVCLKDNLGLDENWEGNNRKLVSGKVKIENYTIYNVTGDHVEVCRMDRGKEEHSKGKLGEIAAPNGQVIQHTGVYGEISYLVKGIFGVEIMARKGKLVDIVGAQQGDS